MEKEACPPNGLVSEKKVEQENHHFIIICACVTQSLLRTEVRGDFNIHGTKYFYDAVFHQKSKKCVIISLLYLWLAKKPVLYMKYWQGWLLLIMAFSVITCQYFMERTGCLAHQRYRRLTTSQFFYFWWKTASYK